MGQIDQFHPTLPLLSVHEKCLMTYSHEKYQRVLFLLYLRFNNELYGSADSLRDLSTEIQH